MTQDAPAPAPPKNCESWPRAPRDSPSTRKRAPGVAAASSAALGGILMFPLFVLKLYLIFYYSTQKDHPLEVLNLYIRFCKFQNKSEAISSNVLKPHSIFIKFFTRGRGGCSWSWPWSENGQLLIFLVFLKIFLDVLNVPLFFVCSAFSLFLHRFCFSFFSLKFPEFN